MDRVNLCECYGRHVQECMEEEACFNGDEKRQV